MLTKEKEILKNVMAFWPSIGKWYKRKCDFSGDTIITNYPPTSKFPVYKSKYFYQDGRTPTQLEYDPNKSFFEQLKNLQETIPHPHMLGANYENCDYCDDVRNSKNCFLSSSMLECENIYYCYRTVRCKDSINLVSSFDCNLCFGLTYCFDCYKVIYGFANRNCSDSYFLYDCRNTKNCTMCRNLRNKEYCILNQQYSKEEYFQKLKEYDLGSRKSFQKLKKTREEHLKNDALHPENQNEQSELSVGNYLTKCKNVKECVIWEEGEDCENCFRGLENKSSKNCCGLLQGELCDMVNQSSYMYNVKYSSYSDNCKNSEYLDNCSNCEDCFACIGIRNKKYHILNKEYSKEEYEKLKNIIEENMKKSGEFNKPFPYNMMYSGYNTTLARFFFPDTKENILKMGGYREDEIINIETTDTNIIEVPDHINQIDENIISKTFKCTKTGQLFNFTKQAIELYKRLNVPLSDTTYLQNIIEQYEPLSRRREYQGKCFITGQEITHYYPPESGYKKIVSIKAYEKSIL